MFIYAKLQRTVSDLLGRSYSAPSSSPQQLSFALAAPAHASFALHQGVVTDPRDSRPGAPLRSKTVDQRHGRKNQQ